MWVALSLAVILTAGVIVFLHSPRFGRVPHGERLERMSRSPRYSEGAFRNLSHTPQLTSDKGFFRQVWDFMFRNNDRVRPEADVPAVKTDLQDFGAGEEVLVWFGHGSYYLQSGGKRFAVDPVFYSASPVSFYNKPFRGTGIYTPQDLPDLDYIIITHDHWDHLDYRTVKELRESTGAFVCPLGVGSHLERWGVQESKIIETDWYESVDIGDGFTVHCLPARHFSGRGLKANRTLWASYMLETPSMRIYIGGDGGYDSHFREIGDRFRPIDLAILENGQYGEGWKYIHLLPEDLLKAVDDLSPRRLLTVHNSKYALAMHPWDEPLELIAAASRRDSIPLLTPRIGEPVYLDDPGQVFDEWWK